MYINAFLLKTHNYNPVEIMLQKQGDRLPIWSPAKSAETFWHSPVGPNKLRSFNTWEAAGQGNTGVYVNFLINLSFA